MEINAISSVEPAVIPPMRKKRGRPRKPENVRNGVPVVKKPHAATSRSSKHDWDNLKQRFIEGITNDVKKPFEREYLNVKEFAIRYNVPYNTIKERVAIEAWYDQRQANQLHLAKSRQSKRITELNNESIEFDTKNIKIAKTGMDLITIRLSEIAEEVSLRRNLRKATLEAQSRGEVINPKDLYSAIYPKDLMMLAQAGQLFQAIGDKALGTDIIKHQLTIDGTIDVDVEARITSISQELGRSDTTRLAAMIEKMQQTGLFDDELIKVSNQSVDAQSREIENADIISESEEIINTHSEG